MLYRSVTKPWFALLGLVFLALRTVPAACLPLTIPIEHYVLSEGSNHQYFDGKLLTADDLGSEQSYKRGSDRYLGTSDLPLAQLFARLGYADVLLALEGSLLTPGNFSPAADPTAPQQDDMIFLDTATLTWRGRLFVPGVNGTAGGVYDDLSGSFSALRSIPEPGSAVLIALSVLCSAGQRRIRYRCR